MYSSLQNFNRGKIGDKEWETNMREARGHLECCAEVYEMQEGGDRCFVHEHPLGSKSWDEGVYEKSKSIREGS
jgi:hypothetical protein